MLLLLLGKSLIALAHQAQLDQTTEEERKKRKTKNAISSSNAFACAALSFLIYILSAYCYFLFLLFSLSLFLFVSCTSVLKPSELTPYSALALAELGVRAGLPAGVFNVVTGHAKSIGSVLTTDPRVKKITFTGSTPVGKLLYKQSADTVKRLSMELGGNAPFLM